MNMEWLKVDTRIVDEETEKKSSGNDSYGTVMF